MCIVCKLYEQEKITRKEAMKAFWEQIAEVKTAEEKEHIQEVYGKMDREQAEEEGFYD